MDEGRKRPYHHSYGCGKQKSVEPGVSGLLFTCSGNEKFAVREAYNIIDRALELQEVEGEGHEVSSVGDLRSDVHSAACGADLEKEGEDISDTIKRFCENARDPEAHRHKKKRIRQCPTGAKNCLFFMVGKEVTENICELADKIIELARDRPCCRLLQRVLPVEVTCPVDLPTINQELSKLIHLHFVVNNGGIWSSFSVEFKARNNDRIKRRDALNMTLDALQQMAPACRANLSDPDIAILFQVVRTTVMLSCVRNFNRRKKFSLHSEDAKTKSDASVNNGGRKQKQNVRELRANRILSPADAIQEFGSEALLKENVVEASKERSAKEGNDKNNVKDNEGSADE